MITLLIFISIQVETDAFDFETLWHTNLWNKLSLIHMIKLFHALVVYLGNNLPYLGTVYTFLNRCPSVPSFGNVFDTVSYKLFAIVCNIHKNFEICLKSLEVCHIIL